jgi:glycolate oxidase FAD binding subunit
MNFAGQLESILGSEFVVQNSTLTVDGCRPSLIVKPANELEVTEILRFASIEKLKVLPFGGGSKIHIGNIPSQIDIAVSTLRLTHTDSYEPADLTAIVGAGFRSDDFFELTSKNGQWLPFNPPGKGATLGGIVATNAFGSLRTAYGTPRDYVIGLKIVTADGTLIKTGGRVVKNVAGYDLNKLFVGSYGTLGIVVETAFKLRPIPESETSCLVTSQNFAPLASLANQIHRSELLPMSALLMDTKVLRLFDVPPGTAQWALLLRFGDSQAAIVYQLEEIRKLVESQSSGSFTLPNDDVSDRLWRGIGDFEDNFGAEVTLRISTLPNQITNVIFECESLFKKSDLGCSIIAHTVNGVVYLYIKHLGDSASARGTVLDVIKKLRTKFSSEGYVIVERAPIAIKREIEVWGEPRGTAPLLHGLKQKIDPNSTFVPGRYVCRI